MGKPWENDGFMGFNGIYPLVNVHISNWKDSPCEKGKLTSWPFSIAMFVYQRVLRESPDVLAIWL